MAAPTRFITIVLNWGKWKEKKCHGLWVSSVGGLGMEVGVRDVLAIKASFSLHVWIPFAPKSYPNLSLSLYLFLCIQLTSGKRSHFLSV